MRQQHALLAFAGWFVPALAVPYGTPPCLCWTQGVETIIGGSLTLLNVDQLCKDVDRTVSVLEECFTTQPCSGGDKINEILWLTRICDGSFSHTDSPHLGELKRGVLDDLSSLIPNILPTNGKPDKSTPATTAADPQTTDDQHVPVTTSKHQSPTKKGQTKTSDAQPTTQTVTSSADPTTTSDAPTSTDSTSTETTTPTAASQTSAAQTSTAQTSAPPPPTSTSSPAPTMGGASIAAATIFGAFVAGCIGALAFVCIRRARRHRQARKEDAMDEALLGAGKKGGAGGVGGRRSTNASSRSVESMYANNQSSGSVVNIPLANRQPSYSGGGIYPLGGTAYQAAPQYDASTAYAPQHSRENSPRTYYNPTEAAAQPNQGPFTGYRPASNTYLTPINTDVTGQGVARSGSTPSSEQAPLRTMRSGSLGTSAALNNLPAALTPGGSMTPITPSEPPSRVSTISTTHGPTRSLSIVSEVGGSFTARKLSK